jgi:hypothetical protein
MKQGLTILGIFAFIFGAIVLTKKAEGRGKISSQVKKNRNIKINYSK